MFAEVDQRQSFCIGLPPSLANSTLVENSATNFGDPPTHHQRSPNFSKSKRGKNATPQVGNPFWASGRMSSPQLRNAIRQLETQQDISPTTKKVWLEWALETCTDTKQRTILKQAIVRAKRAQKKAKHQIFYDIKPLVDFAFPQKNPPKFPQGQTTTPGDPPGQGGGPPQDPPHRGGVPPRTPPRGGLPRTPPRAKIPQGT